MPPTTRSMQQQRLSGAPKGSSPSVRDVSARNTPQPGFAQRTTASVSTRGGPESRNDDDDDNDDDEGSGDDGSDDDSEDGDSSDADSDDDDDEAQDAPAAIVLRLFAIAEPNGVVPDEVNLADVAQTVSDEASYVWCRIF